LPMNLVPTSATLQSFRAMLHTLNIDSDSGLVPTPWRQYKEGPVL
jgi:hypothetical protein